MCGECDAVKKENQELRYVLKLCAEALEFGLQEITTRQEDEALKAADRLLKPEEE